MPTVSLACHRRPDSNLVLTQVDHQSLLLCSLARTSLDLGDVTTPLQTRSPSKSAQLSLGRGVYAHGMARRVHVKLRRNRAPVCARGRMQRSGAANERTVVIAAVVGVFVIVVGAGTAYRSLIPGLSSARTKPGPVETIVATWLLHRSVPVESKARTTRWATTQQIAAGSELFKQKCEVCHAYDGGGENRNRLGEYPRPPALRSMDVASMSTVRFSITSATASRNTRHARLANAGPQIWPLVAFIRHIRRRSRRLKPAFGPSAKATRQHLRTISGRQPAKSAARTFMHAGQNHKDGERGTRPAPAPNAIIPIFPNPIRC